MINVFEPAVGPRELEAVEATLASSWIGRGPRVREFEEAFAALIERPVDELVAVSSASEGLFHAIAALGLGPDDDVVLPTVSFVGAAHAVRSVGARIVLCDVDPATLNPTREHIEAALTLTTRAVVLLHFGGGPGAVAEIASMLRARSIILVEDAAVGLGACVGGTTCGTLGDIGVWSFDAMKLVTAGDGGMVWCRNRSHLERVRLNATLGGSTSGFHQGMTTRWWELDPQTPGRRSVMNDIGASLGLVQLARLDALVARRAMIAARYERLLADLKWLRVQSRESSGAVRTFCWVHADHGLRDSLAEYLLEAGIYTTFKYWPLHRMALYRDDRARFPGAERAAASALLLPLHNGLSDDDVTAVVGAIRAFPGAQ